MPIQINGINFPTLPIAQPKVVTPLGNNRSFAGVAAVSAPSVAENPLNGFSQGTNGVQYPIGNGVASGNRSAGVMPVQLAAFTPITRQASG